MNRTPVEWRRLFAAVALQYALGLGLAWSLGAPIAAAASAALGLAPGADPIPILARSGSLLLMESWSQAEPIARAWADTALPILLASTLLGSLPLWLTLRALVGTAPEAPPQPRVPGLPLRRAAHLRTASLGAVLVLSPLFLLLRLAWIAGVVHFQPLAENLLGGLVDPRPADFLGLSVLALGLGGLGLLRALADFSYAAAVQRRQGARAALDLGASALLRHPARHLVVFAVGLLAYAGLITVARLSPRFLGLQLLLLLGLVLRAAWLGYVVRQTAREWPPHP